MQLQLDPDDTELLGRVLTDYLSELREEVGKTENYELRQTLKQDEERIKSLLGRLTA